VLELWKVSLCALAIISRKLNLYLISVYFLKISTDKTKIMAFKGKHLAHSKIEIARSLLEKVKKFNYLGCELSLEGEPDFEKK
jgi:hypothetical protein